MKSILAWKTSKKNRKVAGNSVDDSVGVTASAEPKAPWGTDFHKNAKKTLIIYPTVAPC